MYIGGVCALGCLCSRLYRVGVPLGHGGAQASDLDFGRQPILILMARLKVTPFSQVIGGYPDELAALLVCGRFDSYRDHSGHGTCNNLRLCVSSDLMS